MKIQKGILKGLLITLFTATFTVCGITAGH